MHNTFLCLGNYSSFVNLKKYKKLKFTKILVYEFMGLKRKVMPNSMSSPTL